MPSALFFSSLSWLNCSSSGHDMGRDAIVRLATRYAETAMTWRGASCTRHLNF